MKKNWLSYICMAVLLSGILSSCNESSFLDLKDPNHFTGDNFWKNKADAESATRCMVILGLLTVG